MKKRLGILGGTFDPPHIGHLVLADQACAQLELRLVLFCPVGQQPLKLDRPATPVQHRVAMVQRAIAGHPHLMLSRVDIDRPGPHYTADTLALLRSSYPDDVLYFLMGADSLQDLLKWHEPQRIIAQAQLVVARRPGATPDLISLEASLPGLSKRIIWLDSPWLDISASDLRRRVRMGYSVRYLVPPAVEAYIMQNGLYQERTDDEQKGTPADGCPPGTSASLC